jgi:chromosome segregation ATPase
MRDIIVFKQYNSSANDSHFSLSSIDQIAHAIETMKNKLSTVVNKLTKLKIENMQLLQRIKELESKIEDKDKENVKKLTKLKIENMQLFKRVKELKNKIEDKNMKNVDAMIDLLEKDFNDEAFSLT